MTRTEKSAEVAKAALSSKGPGTFTVKNDSKKGSFVRRCIKKITPSSSSRAFHTLSTIDIKTDLKSEKINEIEDENENLIDQQRKDFSRNTFDFSQLNESVGKISTSFIEQIISRTRSGKKSRPSLESVINTHWQGERNSWEKGSKLKQFSAGLLNVYDNVDNEELVNINDTSKIFEDNHTQALDEDKKNKSSEMINCTLEESKDDDHHGNSDTESFADMIDTLGSAFSREYFSKQNDSSRLNSLKRNFAKLKSSKRDSSRKNSLKRPFFIQKSEKQDCPKRIFSRQDFSTLSSKLTEQSSIPRNVSKHSLSSHNTSIKDSSNQSFSNESSRDESPKNKNNVLYTVTLYNEESRLSLMDTTFDIPVVKLVKEQEPSLANWSSCKSWFEPAASSTFVELDAGNNTESPVQVELDQMVDRDQRGAVFMKLKNNANVVAENLQQAASALKYCVKNVDFKGSKTQVDLERLLLLSSTKFTSIMKELRSVYFDEPAEPTSEGQYVLGKPTFHVNGISRADRFNYYFVCLMQYKDQVFVTKVEEMNEENLVVFEETFRFSNLSHDFKIEIHLYMMKLPKSSKLMKKMIKLCKIPLLSGLSSRPSFIVRHISVQTNNFLEYNVPFSAFRLCASTHISLASQYVTHFTSNKISDKLSRVDSINIFQNELMTVDFNIKKEGYVSLALQPHSHVWFNLWAVLSGSSLKFYQKKSTVSESPLYEINLKYVLKEEVQDAGEIFDGMKETLYFKVANPSVFESLGTIVEHEYFVAFGSSLRYKRWQKRVNNVTSTLKLWRQLYVAQ